MKRRASFFAWAALPFALAYGLVACGGSNSGAGTTSGFRGLTLTPTNAKVTLPASRSYASLADLNVWTSAGEGSPSAAGDISVQIFNNGPQYTEVRDADENLVAAGFVGTDRTSIGLESTAEVLTYFAIGGPIQRGSDDSQQIVLEGVKSLPGFTDVVAAVTASFNTNGFVANDDAAIQTALDAVRDGVLASRARQEASTRGPDVSPTKVISGLEINNDVNDQIQITNTAFRRGHMWLSRTGFKDDEGNKRDLDEAIVNREITLPGRYGGQVNSATGLITGQYSWSPATMNPETVSSDISGVDNEAEVYYQLTTVGIGRLPGDFEDLTGEQINKWEEIVYQTCYLDFYLPVFANLVLPLDGAGLDSVAEFASKDSEAKAFFTAARSSMANVAAETAKGRFSNGLAQFINSAEITAIESMTRRIMVDWGHQYGMTLFDNEQDLLNRVKRASVAIRMLNLTIVVEEMAPLQDLRNADQANIFQITSSKSSVKLVADNDEIGLTDTANIEAIIKDKQSGVTYRYEWTVNNSNFFVQDVDGNGTDEAPGGILKSPHDKVFIGNLSNNEGTPTITCRVYNGTTLIGTANTRVAFKDKVREGTGRIQILGRVIDYDGDGDYGVHTLVVAEVDKFENAAHYNMVANMADGEEIERKNWSPDRNPFSGIREEFRPEVPGNFYWIVLYGSSPEAESLTRGDAEELMADELAQLTSAFTGAKLKITVYFE